jgi:CPA2 family monovalent cation:H+ antiporter-2
MLVGGMLLVPRLVRFLAKRGQPETLLIVALAICFGLAILTERVGYPVALGAFVAGLVVAESGLGHEVGERVKPFRDVFAMMFFVSIGMQIDPAQLVEELPTIFVFTALVLVFKPLGVGFGSFAAGRGVQTSMRAGLSLAQNGELSFVIAGIGIASGVVRPSLLAIAVGVTCLTTLTSAVMIRGSEPLADWFAARLPGRFTTFVSFYESWLDRLRSRRDTAWHRVRRPVVVLAIDTAAVVVIVIGGSILGPRAIYSTGLSGFTANAIIAVAVIALSAPFGLGAVRRVVQIARMLALIVFPEGGEVDLGRAPRRALTLMLELAIAAVVTIPVVATIQPFTGTASLVVGGVVVFLIAITYRSIVDFTQHVHAGSELILELMKSAPEETATIGPQIETMLPGFGGLVSITLADTSSAVGKSLAELNLRARTGATVLAIGRGGGGFATPTPSEALAAGDVLALTGSDDALEAAKRTLGA